jgi:hypothetical protein
VVTQYVFTIGNLKEQNKFIKDANETVKRDPELKEEALRLEQVALLRYGRTSAEPLPPKLKTPAQIAFATRA